MHCGTPLPNLEDGATLIFPDRAILDPLQARPASELTGQVIDGNYRLDRLIDGTDFSAVYQATRLKLGDEVAVKIIRPTVAIDDFFRDRFQTLAQAAARLKHPGTVTIHDFDITPKGLVFLVMELAPGYRLRDLVAPARPLEPRVVAGITNQICSVLDQAGQLGMVHGELNLSKVIVKTTPGEILVKVLGFGMAEIRDLARGVRPTSDLPVENLRYFSPEQCMGLELDARSDIYSLASVVFEMLSGRPAFDSTSMITVLSQKLTQLPPLLSTARLDVSPAIQEVLTVALARERDARPSSAGLFAQQLSHSVYGDRIVSASIQASTSTPPSLVTEFRPTPVSAPAAPLPTAVAPLPAANFTSGSTGTGQRAQPLVATRSRSRLPLIIGGVVVVLLVGAVLGAIFLLPSLLNSSNRNQTPNRNQANSDPSGTPPATPDASAETEFNDLREKLLNATPAQRAGVRQDLVSAEGRHPTDYRFPYLRAKLLIDIGREHIESFDALYSAGKKAIENGKAEVLLAELQRDSSTSFERLTDHTEWTKLITALQNKDATSLKLGTHLH